MRYIILVLAFLLVIPHLQLSEGFVELYQRSNSRFKARSQLSQAPLKARSLCPRYSAHQCKNRALYQSVDPLQPLDAPKKSHNLLKRWITGVSLAVMGTLWISSGNGLFSLGFLITSLIAQNEYYNMLKAIGINPASKTGTISSLMCFITAAMFPAYHELVMPLSATILMLWLLIFNKKSPLISEISTSLLGMFYLGYLPSFWVRLRAIDYATNIRFISFLNEKLPFVNLAPDGWTLGAIVTWWTWCSISFADVGAYFMGKSFGKHKLSVVSAAAGSASPNKTIEGAIAGFLSSSLFSVIGAYTMRWPMFIFSGILYGLLISFLALVGDLTASMMKRDAKIKDSGNLLPGHGGVLDRIDSYLFTAPAAYFFVMNILPLLHRIETRYLPLRR
ncbi:MAG: phosphatidate cytidylyltransferase [Alphaproteobacteria bacterium]|nr:phosphatidate cytidylyltransferase [Alphaproteobacteria bacterium]